MDLPDKVNEYLKHIVRCIKETMPVTAIYLFGSYATGNYHEDSDLDIYVVTTDKSRRIIDLRRAASWSVGFPLEMPLDILVGYEDDFTRKSKQLGFVENEVLKKGIDIYAYS